MKLKERKPQRLAPLAQRDGNGSAEDIQQKQPSYDMMDGIEVSDDMQQMAASNDGVAVDNATEDHNQQE